MISDGIRTKEVRVGQVCPERPKTVNYCAAFQFKRGPDPTSNQLRRSAGDPSRPAHSSNSGIPYLAADLPASAAISVATHPTGTSPIAPKKGRHLPVHAVQEAGIE